MTENSGDDVVCLYDEGHSSDGVHSNLMPCYTVRQSQDDVMMSDEECFLVRGTSKHDYICLTRNSILGEELGALFSDVFSCFDEVPLSLVTELMDVMGETAMTDKWILKPEFQVLDDVCDHRFVRESIESFFSHVVDEEPRRGDPIELPSPSLSGATDRPFDIFGNVKRNSTAKKFGLVETASDPFQMKIRVQDATFNDNAVPVLQWLFSMLLDSDKLTFSIKQTKNNELVVRIPITALITLPNSDKLKKDASSSLVKLENLVIKLMDVAKTNIKEPG